LVAVVVAVQVVLVEYLQVQYQAQVAQVQPHQLQDHQLLELAEDRAADKTERQDRQLAVADKVILQTVLRAVKATMDQTIPAVVVAVVTLLKATAEMADQVS
jgi:hypothetical protein